MMTQIYNGKILLPSGNWLNGGSILIRNGKIIEIFRHSRIAEGVDKIIDARGDFVLPGGIDMHVHGAGGRDFLEASEEAFNTAVAVHRRYGTTSIFPTLVSASEDNIRKSAEICNKLMDDPKTGVMGLHVEGPYFNKKMAGSQSPEQIRLPDSREYISIIEDYPCIKRWDAAPELPGADQFARYITSKGVIAGIAHTRANYKDIRNAYDSGYTMATHFYNAMTTSHKDGIYKHEGTVEAIYLMDGIHVEVIADGIHVPPIILKLVHKFKGTDRMSLVTDALAITKSPDGKSFDPRIEIENGVCKLRDGSAIAGSCCTMDRLIRTAVISAGIPLEDVSRMVSENPARFMGIYDCKGSLSKHKDADIIILDKDLRLTHVVAMGEEVECGDSSDQTF